MSNDKELIPFFVKVLKRSPFTYKENKDWVGKIVQVTIDPVNSAYYLFYPKLPIQELCDSDGRYSRKGYIYGLAVVDCEIIINPKAEERINEAWEQFKKELPQKAPIHFTLNSLIKFESELTALESAGQSKQKEPELCPICKKTYLTDRVCMTCTQALCSPFEPDKKTETWDKIKSDFFKWTMAKWCPTHEQIFEWFKTRLPHSQPEKPVMTAGIKSIADCLSEVGFSCKHLDLSEHKLLEDGIKLYASQKPETKEISDEKNARKRRVFDFVVKHKTDCYRAFKISVDHKGFNTKEGSLLIELARTEIGYSRKTWDGDIYHALHRVYKSIVSDGKMDI